MGVSGSKESVALVRLRDQNTFAALERAADLIGGIEDVVPAGSVVLVKPNLVMGPTERGVTDPIVLESVLRLVRDRAPSRIVIGEGAADSYTWNAFRVWNIYDMATRYGAEVIDLNREECIPVDVPDLTGRDHVMLPRIAAEADALISVPTFKLWMGKLPMSLSLKNLFGLYPATYYGHNKTSRELAATAPDRTLEGEIGRELGIHHPSVEQSIAAINLARSSDLTVIDALEGGDGKGNSIRMDMLMVGRNPVATDAVALAVAGFVPGDQRQIALCSQLGLGPADLADIEVLGESVDSTRLVLDRLKENILEMPIDYCLDRLHTRELSIIADGLRHHDFLNGELPADTPREELASRLAELITARDYLPRALGCLPPSGRTVLDLVIASGGTSGNYYDILGTYTSETGESNSFWAGLRSLMRLGLAFLMHGHTKPYIILTDGVGRARQDSASRRP